MKISLKHSSLATRLQSLGTRVSQVARAHRVWLRLPHGWPETATAVHWHALAADAPAQRGRADTIADLPAFVRAARVHIWTPPAETLLVRASLPTRSRARILQALPYALEDQLLAEPEKLQFAYTHNPDGSLAVAVTDRARLKLWLDALGTAGVRPASLCPAHLALPLETGAWSLAFVDDELWVRTGLATGFTCRASVTAPPALLVNAVRELTEKGPQRIVIYGPPPALALEDWSAALGVPVAKAMGDFWVAAEAPPLNLLQGELAPSGHLRELGRPLLPAAVMLGAWLVGAVVVDVVEWARLQQRHRAYTAEMRDLLLKSFPETKTILDPYAQMQKNLESLQSRGGGASDLLPLLGRIAPILQAQSQTKLQGIKYGERSLTLELTLPDYQALDALKNRMEAQSLAVEVIGANSRGNEVEGRLRVQAGAAKARAS